MNSSPRVRRPHTHSLHLLLMSAATILLAVASVLTISPVPAHAVSSTGHGVGYLSKADNFSWLGSYRMSDGRFAFCLEAGKPSPVGNSYATTTTDDLPGQNAASTAMLAYIARTWATTQDRDTAAAAQLAVWTITGLSGHTQEFYAARANERANIVLTRARAMFVEAEGAATKSVRVEMGLSVPESDEPMSVLADLFTDRVGSGATNVAANSHKGIFELAGATFLDGSTRKELGNGVRQTIRPVSNSAVVRVRSDANFSRLPFGRTVTIGQSPALSQALLFSAVGNASAGGSATAEVPSRLPFQPSVVTKSSSATAVTGASITDRLTVALTKGEGLTDTWGVYREGTALRPIPVTVRSRLLGPFESAPVEASEWPAEAPVVCEVATVFDKGPADATTSACRLPATGHYVWVETIDPADTPVEKGGSRLRPWKSPFGVASETTNVPVPPVVMSPTIRTRVEAGQVEPGACVADTLVVSDLAASPEVEFDVESTLVGPLTAPVADGHDFGSDFDDLPVAGRVVTKVTGNGTFDSPCIEVVDRGHYFFVFRSDGSAKDATGHQVVAPFSDLVAHRSEMVEVVPPTVPTPPPSTPPVTPPTPKHPVPPALAFTGSSLGGPLLGGIGALSVGAAAVAGRAISRRIRARRTSAVDEVVDEL